MKTNKRLFLVRAAMALLCTLVSTSVMADDGEPQVSSSICYYEIYTEEDWNKAADEVAHGAVGGFESIKINLHSDISVSTMMASSNSHYLKGAIDGNGHTITVNFGSENSPWSDPYVGLFRFVSDFAVERLNVVGNIYTKERYAGGIVSNSDDEVRFRDCTSGVVIHSSYKGEGTHGGFVANANVAKFTNCGFYGKLLTTNGTKNCGGFAGWIDNDLFGTDLYIDHCLYAPAPLKNGETEPTESSTFYRNENAGIDAEKVFYTRTLGTAQGTSCSGKSPQEIVNDMEDNDWRVFAGRAVPYYAWRIWTGDYEDFLDGKGTEEEPYIIKSTRSWNTFTGWTHRGAGEGIYYKLTEDIDAVQLLAASEAQPFCGIFNGGGHVMAVYYPNTDGSERTAPFSYVDGATIQNLMVVGSITGTQHDPDASRAAGVIGETGTTTSHIINCVCSVKISGDDYVGGFSIGGNVEIEGCVYNGIINISSEGKSGGFVGYSQSTLKITNSIFAPRDGSSISGGTFYFNGDAGTLTNCFYDDVAAAESGIEKQGKQLRSIIADENVTMRHAGKLTRHYDLSHITAYKATDAYDDSDPFIAGILFNQMLYAGCDDEVNLTLSNDATGAPAGYKYGNYSVSSGTLSGNATDGYTLQMPDDDVFVDVDTDNLDNLIVIDWEDENEGTEDDPYMIYNKDQLLLLAYRVNGTHGERAYPYTGSYFKLGADIEFPHPDDETDEYAENYEPIGVNYYNTDRIDFGGHFDGDNKTVSGIRIRNDEIYIGLFGRLEENTDIHHVRLTDARIQGSLYVGGIVGDASIGTVRNCTVTESVITATDYFSFGYGTISGTKGSTTLSQNYYHHCTVNGKTTNVGCDGKDVTANDGAVPMPALIDNEDNTDAIATLASRGEQGLPTSYPVVLDGRTLYKDGNWNTLCLPFGVEDGDTEDGLSFSGTPLEGATVMELDTEDTYDDGKQTGIDGTMFYLYFKDATSIVAGRPYIVKWDEDTENTELKEPIFWDVTVSNAENVVSFPGGAFKGTYSPVTLAADDRSVLYVGTGTTLRWPTEDRTIGACRAYFELNEAGLAAREFVLNFDGEKTTTNISPAEIKEIAEMAGAWYCLDGRKLQGKPTKKGVYVRNGKKIVVK